MAPAGIFLRILRRYRLILKIGGLQWITRLSMQILMQSLSSECGLGLWLVLTNINRISQRWLWASDSSESEKILATFAVLRAECKKFSFLAGKPTGKGHVEGEALRDRRGPRNWTTVRMEALEVWLQLSQISQFLATGAILTEAPSDEWRKHPENLASAGITWNCAFFELLIFLAFTFLWWRCGDNILLYLNVLLSFSYSAVRNGGNIAICYSWHWPQIWRQLGVVQVRKQQLELDMEQQTGSK